jgi:hypothetical protein
MAFSYKKAMEKKLLSETDIRRLAAGVLAMGETAKGRLRPLPQITQAKLFRQPNFAVAAAGYEGVAGSFSNAWFAIHKKLSDADCFIDGDEAAATPRKKRATAPRKAKDKAAKPADSNGSGEDGDAEQDEAPKKKKAAPRKAKAAKPADGDGSGDDAADEKEAPKKKALVTRKRKAAAPAADGDGAGEAGEKKAAKPRKPRAKKAKKDEAKGEATEEKHDSEQDAVGSDDMEA